MVSIFHDYGSNAKMIARPVVAPSTPSRRAMQVTERVSCGINDRSVQIGKRKKETCRQAILATTVACRRLRRLSGRVALGWAVRLVAAVAGMASPAEATHCRTDTTRSA